MSLYVEFGLQTYSHRAIPLTQRSSERVRGCWHISNTIVNNYDMTVKPYYQLLGISVRSCKHSCLAFLWNTALGRQEKEGMRFPFRRDHRVLAQSHSNRFFGGGSTLALVMLRSCSFVPSLATAWLLFRSLQKIFWQVAHSSKPRKDATPNWNV